jgi:peptidoglycan hydrolase CwlO-like protein
MSDNGTARLDRIEKALELLIADHEQFRDEHKALLRSQVILQDNLEKLVKHDAVQDRRLESVDRRLESAEREIAENRENQKRMDERVQALVSAIGDYLRAQQRNS